MTLELRDRVAVVTGASKGMGRAAAAGLAAEGADLCLVARGEEALARAAQEIAEANGRELMTIPGDVADPGLADLVIGKVIERWGRLDILVNNAGGPPRGSFLDHNEAAWEAALQLNLRSVIRFSRAAVPHMKAGNWGRIVNITSSLAKEPTAPMVLSATARAGVSAFSKAISIELASHNVMVNTVCPGGVLTERLVGLLEARSAQESVSYEQLLAQSVASIPAGRFAEPEEIANVIVFLASERNRYVTGASIMIDGSLTKGIF